MGGLDQGSTHQKNWVLKQIKSLKMIIFRQFDNFRRNGAVNIKIYGVANGNGKKCDSKNSSEDENGNQIRGIKKTLHSAHRGLS